MARVASWYIWSHSCLDKQWLVAGHPSLTSEEAILYTLASCHFIQGTLLDMALTRVAIEGEWA